MNENVKVNEKTRNDERTKKITMLAMLAAIAYAVMYVGRIPIVLFLKYDPKDIVLIIAGFIFGPVSSFMVSFIVCLVEMFTVSETGIIGFIMNLLASSAFVCTAAFIYKKKRTMKGAILGLAAGCLLMTAAMLAWNYLLTPLYMNMSREKVKAMLLPTFLPFNLLKGGVNLSVAMLIYKPVVTALRRAQLIPPSKKELNKKSGNLAVMVVSGLVLITCILIILAMNGKI